MEILIWIVFLIVYSIIQSLGKKKKPAGQSPADATGDKAKMPTLEDALREIQEALQQSRKPAEKTPARQPAETPRLQEPGRSGERKLTPQPRRLHSEEPEFHSLERRIPDAKSIEAQTRYSEKVYDVGTLESEKTYEDEFPESSFYDDTYKHAHMDAVSIPENIKTKNTASPAAILRKRLKNPDYLSEAFIIQQILGPPIYKQR